MSLIRVAVIGAGKNHHGAFFRIRFQFGQLLLQLRSEGPGDRPLDPDEMARMGEVIEARVEVLPGPSLFPLPR